MRFLYDVLFFLFAVFTLPVYLAKAKHRKAFWKRFGSVPPEARTPEGKTALWIHAVSVGEAVQAVRLAGEARRRMPGTPVVLSVTTLAGYEVAAGLKDARDPVVFFPFDFRGAVRSFVDAVRPRALVLLETEIWPGVISELSERGVPVFIVNGRISDRSIGRYRMLGPFLKGLLRRLSGIGVQDETMKARFLELGADPFKVHVTGNMKFDWLPPREESWIVAALDAHFRRETAPFFWIAGSTHEGEEELLWGAYRTLRARRGRVRFLIAPRHLERIPAILRSAARSGVRVRKVSEALARNGSGDWGEDILLLDQMGVLAGLYRLADAIFIGGSLVPVGGHNPVEPAFFEKPVLFGPHMENFREMAEEFQRAGAAVRVGSAADLEKELAALWEDPERRRRLGRAARDLVTRHQGATRRNAERIVGYLNRHPRNLLSRTNKG